MPRGEYRREGRQLIAGGRSTTDRLERSLSAEGGRAVDSVRGVRERPGLRKRSVRLLRRSPAIQAALVELKRTRVAQRSPHRNLYHCCTQKTASQWFRRLFTSAMFFDYTGLQMVPYTGQEDAFGLGLRYATITEPFPRHTAVAHLYVDRATYDAIPKAPSYKTFFVLRDPRDIVVS